ncbi:hypothetical protein [Acidaminobacterium chupaoyuni]|jgi:hypothetical protein|nr:hypothetical protein [Oscillospiraceae bacterium]
MDDYLKTLHLTEITPAEKHWLDERLSDMSVKERLILNGLTVYAPPKSGMDVVNLVQNIHDCDICFDIGKEDGLGVFVAREVECISQEYMGFIDTEKLAGKYMVQHPGVFVDGNYIEISEDGLWPYYDGTNLDQLTDDSWSVKLKLASSDHPEGVWLRLPDYQDANDGKPDEIKIALTALEALRVDECHVLEAKCILPHAGDLVSQYDSIADLIYDGNNLGYVLDERGQGMRMFMELFHGAMEYEGCTSLGEALDVAENLNRYELVPLSGLKEYAMGDLKKRGVKLSDAVAAAFDFEQYAADMIEKKGFVLSEDGQAYIGKIGAVPRHSMDTLHGMVLE